MLFSIADDNYPGSGMGGSERLLKVLFELVAMDLVGLLVKMARGHQYIQVIVDYATRYPEVIPVRTAESKGIAQVVFHLFSRVGIPREILMAQGTTLMSCVMKDVCNLLQIKQVRTSGYHPKMDGIVKCFSKTLKQMLMKVIERDGRSWDQLLPHLMFSVRKKHQASTGFSPFELLYGRQPHGLLDLASEVWEDQPTPFHRVVEQVEEMRERMGAGHPQVLPPR